MRQANGPFTDLDGVACSDFAVFMATDAFLEASVLPTVEKFASSSHFALAFLARWRFYALAAFPEETVNKTFLQVLDVAFKQFMLAPSADPSTQGHRNAAPVKPESVSMANNLGFVLTTLLVSRNDKDFRRICAALNVECQRSKPENIKDIVLPALRAIDMQAVDALHLDIGPIVKQLYTGTLTRFILRYVGPAPPMGTWSGSTVWCNCSDCQQLNAFLQSSTQHVWRYAVGKSRRHHLHIQLDSYTQCTHETERWSYPETLVVTKKDRQRAQYDAWAARCVEARRQLSLFPSQERLRRLMERPEILPLLHALDYEALKRGPSDATTLQSTSASATALAPTTSNKRKAEADQPEPAAKKRVIIDLCSDSE